jgi:hypothetical protein
MTDPSGQKAARNGSAFEMQLKAALDNHPRYAANYQFRLDTGKADGRPCRYDAMVYDRQTGQRIVISCKAQHSSGSTEEKVPFELLHLSHSLQSEVAERAYLVLFGNGFSRVKDFYLSRQFKQYMPKLAYGADWPDTLIMTNIETLCGLIHKEKL